MITDASVPPLVFAALQGTDRPTIAYDTAGIHTDVLDLRRNLREALGPSRAYAIHQSLKANAFVPLLGFLSRLGLGCEVASLEEFATAKAVGFRHVCATSPAFRADEVAALARDGVVVNIDSLHQFDGLPWGTPVALRARLPRLASDSTPAQAYSRFGLDLSDPHLHDLLRARDHRVHGLHFHARDVGTAADLLALIDHAIVTFSAFPDVVTLNLGGGMTRLHRDPRAAREAWSACRSRFDALPKDVRVVLEPGAQLLTRHGYLGARVLGIKTRADGDQVCTVDASAWRLRNWSRTTLVHPRPAAQGPTSDIVGPTCYEDDVWFDAIPLPGLAPGDLMIIRGLGAYVTSMSRQMHLSPPPGELLV